MPTYRELMDAASNAQSSGNDDAAKRLFELAQNQQDAPAPVSEASDAPSSAPDTSSGFGSTKSMYGIGSGQSGSLSVPEGMAPAIMRYGVPVGVGLATGGASVLPTIAAGVLSSGGGEFLAQSVEKAQGKLNEYAPRDVAESSAYGLAAPVKVAVKVAPSIVNFLANSAVNVGASELGRYLKTGKFEKPSVELFDNSMRFGVPIAGAALSTAISAKAEKVSNIAAEREAISNSRFGGSVMASEILPQYTGLEAKVISDGNELALNALKDLDAEIGPTLIKAYAGAKDSATVANQLSPHVGELEKLRQSARLARDEANRLEAQAAEAIASQRADALKLKADAKEAGMRAAVDNYAYEQGKERLFGGSFQRVGTIVSGASMDNLRSVAKAAKESTDAGLDRIYSSLDIGLNDTIVNVKDIVKSATKASAKGLGLESDLAKREFIETLGKSLDQISDESGNISLSGYRRIRDSFVQELTKKTGDATYANRVASASYDVIKDAANSYVAKNLPKSQSDKWMFANAAAADVYKAKKTNVIDLIAEGNMDGVLALMKKEGMASPVLKEIDAYAASIAGLGGNKSKYAAARFKNDTIDAMRDSLVESSLNFGKGQDNSFKIINFPKLISTLDELRQRKFPVELFGLGSVDDIRKLARVSSAGTEGGLTSEQFSKFINDRKNFGAGAAAARLEYNKAYKDYLISNDVKTRANAAARMSKSAKSADFKAGQIEAEQINAQSDPIIALLSDTKMGLSKDPAQNGKWIGSLFSMSPSTVNNFVDKLKQSNRMALLEDIKKSAMAEVMRDTFSKAEDAVKNKVNLNNIVNFFEGENGQNRREVLKSLMGQAEYDNFRKNFSDPIKKIVATKSSLRGQYGSVEDVIRPVVSAKSLATNKATGGTLISNAIENVKKAVDEQRYNMIYALYVNPSTAKSFEKSLRNVDKFMGTSAANSMALKMAMEQDAKNKEQKQSPKQ